MIAYVAGVATGFFLIGLYALCVREWDRRRAEEEWFFGPTSGRAWPWWVRAWFVLFE